MANCKSSSTSATQRSYVSRGKSRSPSSTSIGCMIMGTPSRRGYDIALTRQVSEAVSVPVIASGGAGTKEHFYQALTDGKADAALAASLFHYKELEIADLKRYLKERGISVRIN